MLALMKTAPGPGHVELVEIPRPTPGRGQILAEVIYAGICTSDLHVESADIQLNLRTPVITHTFPLTEWRVSFDKMRAREGVKVVLVPRAAA